ncbi:hypothetical protein ACS0TY_016912 [Phlomoides rotata]
MFFNVSDFGWNPSYQYSGKYTFVGWLGLNHSESLFHLSTISKATDNFSINNKLREGGFGTVFKGLLENGHGIAVKCLSRTSLQGLHELKNEVICIAKLQPPNLVKLLGWCIQGEDMMLVYEYMPNKSLDLILFGKNSSHVQACKSSSHFKRIRS